MSDNCNKARENLSIVIENDKQIKSFKLSLLQKLFGKSVLSESKRVTKWLDDRGYDAHEFLTEKVLTKELVMMYGKKADREKLVVLIEGILTDNKQIVNLMHSYMLARIPTGIQMGDKSRGKNVPVSESGIELNLIKFPKSSLQLFYNKALDLTNQVNMFGYGRARIGNRTTWLKSPGKAGWLEATGSIENAVTAVNEYTDKISSRVNLFMSSPRYIRKGQIDDELLKKVQKVGGWEKVRAKLKAAAKIVSNDKIYDDKFYSLFQKYMKNHVFIDTNQYITKDVLNPATNKMEKKKVLNPNYNEFFIHRKYAARRYTKDHELVKKGLVKEGVQMRYPLTEAQKNKNKRLPKKLQIRGAVMFSFQDPVLLKEYTPLDDQDEKYGKKGEFYIDMTPTQLKKFKEAAEDARVILDSIFSYIVPEMAKSTDNLMNKLSEHFDGKLGEFALKQIFFYNETTWKNKQTGEVTDLLANLNDVEKEDVEALKETISMTARDGLVLANQGALQPDSPEYRKNYFPTVYNSHVLKPMLEKYRRKLINGRIEALNVLNTRNLEGDELAYVENILRGSESRLESIDAILDNMMDYQVDAKNSSLLHFASDNKHFKRISNAYDIRSAREDDGVMNDYLTTMMTAIERNNLAAEILESFTRIKNDKKKTKPHLKNDKERTETKAYIVNLHRSTYRSVKLEGMFGSVETFTRKVNHLRYLNPIKWLKKARDKDGYDIAITPELQQKYLTMWNSRISGLFLQGPGSAITNFSGAYKNLVKAGIARTWAAHDLLYDPNYKNKIEDLVQQSGLTNFSDFFSNQMVNGIVEQQLEAQVSDAIMKEMLKYYANQKGGLLGKKMSESEARKEFDKNIAKYLKMSQVWMKAEEVEIRSKARTKKAIRSLKADMKVMAANKLVNYAIDKKYELKPMVNQSLVVRWIQMPFGSFVKRHAEIWSNARITMSNTEKYIRTLSFVIGVENAWETGVIRNDIHWSDYTDPKDVDAAIKIGREYSLWVNYGMSMQNVAPYQWGPAQFFGKFKYWTQLNAEDDIGLYTEGVLSYKDKNNKFRDHKKNVPGKTLNLKAIVKTIAAINSPKLGNRNRRIARPEVAALRTLFLSQMAFQTIWNVLFMNPLNLANFRLLKALKGYAASKIFGIGVSGQLRGLQTDVTYWLTLPIAMAIKGYLTGHGWFGDDDELEDIDKTIREHLSHNPYIGFGGTWAASGFMWAIAAMAGDEDLFKQKGKSVLGIVYGRPTLGGVGVLHEIIEGLVSVPLDVIYDGELDELPLIGPIKKKRRSGRGRSGRRGRGGRRGRD